MIRLKDNGYPLPARLLNGVVANAFCPECGFEVYIDSINILPSVMAVQFDDKDLDFRTEVLPRDFDITHFDHKWTARSYEIRHVRFLPLEDITR